MKTLMKNKAALLFVCVSTLMAVVFSACGESSTEKITQVSQGGAEIVDSVDDLPQCSSVNEGSRIWIKQEGTAMLCVDGKWEPLSGANASYECSAEELGDHSGYKVICNGDSIGVVLNGSKGEDGKDGADGSDGTNGKDGENGVDGLDGANGDSIVSCKVLESFEKTIVVKCGSQSFIVNTETADVDKDSCATDADSECALDDISISGRSEKGPYLRGAMVTAFEILNGRTLKQTGKTFNGEIDANDGRFNVKSVKLSSQYAVIQVNGVYRNEVTGGNSDNSLELRVLTNLKGRGKANVNLMTHLEYNRVSYLVTKANMSVSKAKDQAEREILAAFNIDTTTNVLMQKAEDLSIFGSSEGNAALLAISILLQGDRSAAELKALLSAISYDLEKDGTWDDSTTRAEIAQWAMEASLGFGYRDSLFRKNVLGWNIDTLVPNFEKYLREFWAKEYEIGICGESAAVGSVVTTGNKNIEKYAVANFEDVGVEKNGVNWSHFVCRDSAGVKFWRAAKNIEMDTAGWGHDFNLGSVRKGRVNTDFVYVYEDGNWRRGSARDLDFREGGYACLSGREISIDERGDYYRCQENDAADVDDIKRQWVYVGDTENDTYANRENCSSLHDGDLMNGRVNVEQVYVCDFSDTDGDGERGWEVASTIERVLGGCSMRQLDSVGAIGSVFYICRPDTWKTGTWEVASGKRFDTYKLECTKDGAIFAGLLEPANRYTCDADTFRLLNDWHETYLERGCVSYLEGEEFVAPNKTTWICEDGKWAWNRKSVTGTFIDSRDETTYNTVVIDTMTWMAENLNYVYEEDPTQSYCYKNNESNCSKYGRLYTWPAAMESCPEGWHLPSRTEWDYLVNIAGGKDIVGKVLKSKTGWEYDYGTDDFGFSLMPAGYCNNPSSCVYIGGDSHMWTASEKSETDADGLRFYSDENGLISGGGRKSMALSVRCLKDGN